MIDESGYPLLLEVDGHVSWELCGQMRAAGADLFVAGSSSLYQEGVEIREAVARTTEMVK
jgi:ribulose-phosphate 3-epimerase